ncbi:MAG: D-alanine--D-alanine ligase [Desulfatibacillaceae bacterium]
MSRLRVALLSGGVSSERAISAKSGDQVHEALDKSRYEVVRYDPATDLARLVADAEDIDVALVILHGPYGEDGRIQGFLDLLGIPYQCSGVLGSAVAMDKVFSKWLYERHGLAVPPHVIARPGTNPVADHAKSGIGFPVFVKPNRGGSSIGMGVANDEAELARAVEIGLAEDESVLVEAHITGVELTGAIMGNEELTALPIVEIVPDKRYAFFDYEAKYTPGATTEICPARISEEETRAAQRAAIVAHRALGCRGYSRTDMIMRDAVLYVLETNTIPGMTATSLFPQAAAEAGMSFSRLLDRLIELALEHAGAEKRG